MKEMKKVVNLRKGSLLLGIAGVMGAVLYRHRRGRKKKWENG